MVAIIEGRDPELVEDAYASTQSQEGFRPSTPDVIEPAAKKVHMISPRRSRHRSRRQKTLPTARRMLPPLRNSPRNPAVSRLRQLLRNRMNPSLPSSPEHKTKRGMEYSMPRWFFIAPAAVCGR